MADKISRAELAEAVRELRAEVAQLRVERAAHQCHGCSCTGWVHYYYPLTPQPYVYTPPFQVTCEAPLNTFASTTLTTAAAPAGTTTTSTLFGG